MAKITLEEWAPLLARESIKRRTSLVLLFCLISLAFLAMGFLWQNKFESTVTLFIDDSNIVRPLLEGAAVSTANRDQVYVASEILFSQEILDTVMARGGWVDDSMSLEEKERIKEKIIEKTSIENQGTTLLRIGFEHSEPRTAYDTTRRFADLFLDKTKEDQATESEKAFDFIDSQVETYRKKLADSEKRLQDFRTQTSDARPGTEKNLDARILELRRQIESTELEYAEARSRADALQRELSRVAITADNVYRESQYLNQINELQSEMNLLLLSYTEDYPDIVKLRQQIDDLRQLASREKRVREEQARRGSTLVIGQDAFVSNTTSLNPIYQKLKAEASSAEADANSLQSRLEHTQVLLEKELNRSNKTTDVERKLSDLSRDNQVNHDIFQDLLKRRESARVSMTLDQERQGVLYRIQEPASYPILPKGIRFMHFALAGIVLGFAIPLALLIAFLQVDPRVRLASTVSEELELPLLAVVPHMASTREKDPWYAKRSTLTALIICVLIIYAFVSWLKYTQGS
ncbi:MAG TPA: hypothetical protein DD979_16765 [Gammaproteobacteria bacterium]|jgi:polysaccharide chain length determinant protein (PEP-CTERM system associated)|nr:hypothetical protein [Gammaproteobacteria bacterium]